MGNKERYFKALIENSGRLYEIDLGEKMGFGENETREIIAQLLSEYKIEYTVDGACSYAPVKAAKGKDNG